MPSEDTQFSSTNQPTHDRSKAQKGIPKPKTVLKDKYKELTTDKDGKVVTRLDKMMDAQLDKAENGDTAAFKACLDRSDGQPKQTIEQETHNVLNIIRSKPREEK